jgi:hypothetical protein
MPQTTSGTTYMRACKETFLVDCRSIIINVDLDDTNYIVEVNNEVSGETFFCLFDIWWIVAASL